MIVSHQYKYLFVQNMRTASTSMGKELRQYYGGERILHKHARYSDFLKQASSEEKQYFAFTGQRNPLDALVTLYFREKYQKLDKYNLSPESRKWKGLKQKIYLIRWRYIQKKDLSFEQFFNRYYRHKIDRSYKKVNGHRMDFVYRYEHLQNDFSTILKTIGIEQVRELPQHSKKTQKKASDFYQYYTPAIQRRVQLVFAKSFKEMGYCFPAQWPKPGLIDRLKFLGDYWLRWVVYP